MASSKQYRVRDAFKRSCNCFKAQPKSGGAEPPDIGPRSRSYWHDLASGIMWYYNYFIKLTFPGYYNLDTPDWCKSPPIANDEDCQYYTNGISFAADTTRSGFYVGRHDNMGLSGYCACHCYIGLSIEDFTEEQLELCRHFYVLLSCSRQGLPFGNNENNELTLRFWNLSPWDEVEPTALEAFSIQGTEFYEYSVEARDETFSFFITLDIKSIAYQMKRVGKDKIGIIVTEDNEFFGNMNNSAIIYGKLMGGAYAPSLWIEY